MKWFFALAVMLLTIGTVQAAAPVLRLYTPSAYQVFQRQGTAGTIEIAGDVLNLAAPVDIEAAYNGGAWSTISTGVIRVFSGMLAAVPQGQATLTVRIVGTTTAVTVPYVGIGDVFVIAGQSNAVGIGTYYQTYSHPTLKAGMLGNNYVWRELKDPLDTPAGALDAILNDPAARGTYWLPLASLIMEHQNVPVAFIPAPRGASSILQWQPTDRLERKTMYGAMLNRALLAGGVKAVLWHQGETDARAIKAPEAYAEQLGTLADAIYADLGVPLIVVRLQSGAVAKPRDLAAINRAMKQAADNNPHILLGPDFSDIQADDLAHLKTTAKLQEAARRWWAALETVLYTP